MYYAEKKKQKNSAVSWRQLLFFCSLVLSRVRGSERKVFLTAVSPFIHQSERSPRHTRRPLHGSDAFYLFLKCFVVLLSLYKPHRQSLSSSNRTAEPVLTAATPSPIFPPQLLCRHRHGCSDPRLWRCERADGAAICAAPRRRRARRRRHRLAPPRRVCLIRRHLHRARG